MSTDASFTKTPVAYPSPRRRAVPTVVLLLGALATPFHAAADDVVSQRHVRLVSSSVDDTTARAVLDALDRARGAKVRVVGAASSQGPDGEVELAVAVEHSRFEACVGHRRPTDRATFHAAREECRDDRGIDSTVFRIRLARGAAGDVRITSSAPIEPSDPDSAGDDGDDDDDAMLIEERSRSVAVASVALVDVERDGSLETVVHTVETIETLEQVELDEETRGEDEEVDVVTYVLRVDVLRESGEMATSVPVARAYTGDSVRAPIAVSPDRRRGLSVDRACVVETERGCRAGHVVSRIAIPAQAPGRGRDRGD